MTKKIVTLQVDVEMELEEGTTNDDVLANAIDKLNVPSIAEVKKVERVRDADELTLHTISPGLIVEHEKYGVGIVIELKHKRKRPLGIKFSDGKFNQFESADGFKASDATFEEARCKARNRFTHIDFYPYGANGYLSYKGEMLPTIVSRSTSKVNYKLVIVYNQHSKAPVNHLINVPVERMGELFKTEI